MTVDLSKGTATNTTAELVIVANVDAYLEGRFGGRHTIIGDDGPNLLRGGGRGEAIRGLGGDDTIDGRRGNDLLDGWTGTNSISGGPGRDTCTNPATGPGTVGCENMTRPPT